MTLFRSHLLSPLLKNGGKTLLMDFQTLCGSLHRAYITLIQDILDLLCMVFVPQSFPKARYVGIETLRFF